MPSEASLLGRRNGRVNWRCRVPLGKMLFQPRIHKFATPSVDMLGHKSAFPAFFMTQTHLTDTRFDSFDLDPRILQGLNDAGFIHCTPIQAETLPFALWRA